MHKIFEVTRIMSFLLPYTANALSASLKGHLLLQAAWESIKRNNRMLHDEDHWGSSTPQDGAILELPLKLFKAQVPQVCKPVPCYLCVFVPFFPKHQHTD